MVTSTRNIVMSSVVLASLGLLSGCDIAPLQVTAQPRDEIVEAPTETPQIPAPDPAAAEVPDGYRVEIFARDLIYPTSIEFGKDAVYIAEAGYVYGDLAAPARVWRVSNDGQMAIVADQLNGPVTDLLMHEGRLYISHRGKISMLEGDNRVVDLVTDLPSLGDHFNNQIVAGPDGKLYFGQGTATNSGVVGVDNAVFGWLGKHPQFHDRVAHDIQIKDKEYVTLNPLVMTVSKEPPLVRTGAFQPFGRGAKQRIIKGTTKANGTVMRMNPDGSDLEVFAWGLRNPFGLAFAPDGNLYASDNGYDNRGSRPIANAPDCVWHVKQGAWYGFPDFAAGQRVDSAEFTPEQGEKPDLLMQSHPRVEQPIARFPHQAGVTKIDVSRGEEFGFANHLFVGTVGDMSPITGKDHPVGYSVVRLDPATGEGETFLRATMESLGPDYFEYVATAGPKRPVDVKFSPAGNALYVVDIGAIAVIPSATPTPQPFPGTGVIWRITREGTNVPGPTNLSPLKGKEERQEQPTAPAQKEPGPQASAH